MADREMMVKSISGGWLRVRLDAGSEVSLPEYCHVRLHKSADGRDNITIQEGPHANKPASVKSGYLVEKKHEAGALVTFYVRSNVLTWAGGPAVRPLDSGGVAGGLATFTDPSNRVPAGQWNIEMPDFPHDLGRGYTGFAGHAITWFRLATPISRDRYIHPGTVSLGCTTVGIQGDRTSPQGQAALRGYESLYAYLIGRRKAPGVVGQIQVQDF